MFLPKTNIEKKLAKAKLSSDISEKDRLKEVYTIL